MAALPGDSVGFGGLTLGAAIFLAAELVLVIALARGSKIAWFLLLVWAILGIPLSWDFQPPVNVIFLVLGALQIGLLLAPSIRRLHRGPLDADPPAVSTPSTG